MVLRSEQILNLNSELETIKKKLEIQNLSVAGMKILLDELNSRYEMAKEAITELEVEQQKLCNPKEKKMKKKLTVSETCRTLSCSLTCNQSFRSGREREKKKYLNDG